MTEHTHQSCLSAEDLAAFVDQRMSPAERARAEAHIATCDVCTEALAEMAFAMAANPSVRVIDPHPKPAPRRWWVIGGGLAAIAAAVLIAVTVKNVGFGRGRPELRELIAAASQERPTTGRLAGLPWAPPRSVARSGSNEVMLTPEASIAIAHAEQAVAAHRDVGTLTAFAVAHALNGRLDDSVRALDECTVIDPASATSWSDLAAALLSRSTVDGHADDVGRALESANTALRLDPQSAEARFNKALALEQLKLHDQAIDAWTQYLAIDASSPWAAEARQHIESLRTPSRAPDAQADRERLFDEALPAWASAVRRHSAEADAALAHARDLEQRVDARSPEALARQVIDAIDHAGAGERDALVQGHELYGIARAHYRAGRYKDAQPELTRAGAWLARGGSPLATMAALYSAIAVRQDGDSATARTQLEALDTRLAASRQRYDSIDGRLAWMLAVVRLGEADHRTAGADLEHARDAFVRCDEQGNVAEVEGLLAEHLDSLEEPARAWAARLRSLDTPARSSVFVNAARAARIAGWSTVAEALLREGVAMARQAHRPLELSDALRAHALVEAKLLDFPAAERSLSEAISLADGPASNDPLRAEMSAAAAVVRGPTRPADAIAAATEAIAYFNKQHLTVRLPELYLTRARLLRANDPGAARRDLIAGLNALDEERSTIGNDVARATFGDNVRRLTDELVELELAAGREEAAFEAAERGRSWRTGAAAAGAPVTLDSLSRALAGRATVAYFQVSDVGCHVWSTDEHGTKSRSCTLNRRDAASLVAAFSSDIERPAIGRRLVDGLLAPTLSALADGAPLIIIPDGALSLLPFAALPGRHAEYLIEEHPLLVAPNATALLDSSGRAPHAGTHPAGATVFGAPAVDRAQFPGLAALPEATDEAKAVFSLYDRSQSAIFLGADATRVAFLNSLTQAHVIHFAGHTIVDPHNPERSVIVVAGSPPSGVTMHEIASQRDVHATLVVLSSCEGLAGWLTESDGPLGLARAMLRAGVPTVVASQWRTDDRAARELLVMFHKQYAASGDAVAALQSAQLSLLRSADPSLRDPSKWAGFVAIGGSAQLVHASS